MEQEKKEEETEFVTAQVPRKEHSEIRKLAFDAKKDARDLYKEIIPLGLKIWKEINSITDQPSS